MNLVCFSNNTAGGLVCDLLNNKTNLITGYNTTGREHSLLKVGDTPSVQLTIDINIWNQKVNHLLAELQDTNTWVGTHAHPTAIPDLTVFRNVIVITTTTRESKLYRWLRYYHGWFCGNTPNWQEDNSLEKIDKIRELAKNVFIDFSPASGCDNVEFGNIVNGTFVKNQNLNLEYFLNWKKSNPWLFSNEYTWATKRFCEAEWELQHKSFYKYI
jgi:hypothetical protein